MILHTFNMSFIIYRDNMKLRIYVYKGVLTLRLPPFNPYIAIVIAVLSVSSSAVLVKLAAGVPAGIIANYRLLLAVLIMAPYVLLKYRNELKAIKKKDWLLTTLAGVFLAFHFILWFESLNFTSVASSVVLVTLQPIFAFLGTYFIFCQRFSLVAVISMIIALLGSVIISWGDFQIGGMALVGDILAFLGAIAITGYFLLGQQLRDRKSTRLNSSHVATSFAVLSL